MATSRRLAGSSPIRSPAELAALSRRLLLSHQPSDAGFQHFIEASSASPDALDSYAFIWHTDAYENDHHPQ